MSRDARALWRIAWSRIVISLGLITLIVNGLTTARTSAAAETFSNTASVPIPRIFTGTQGISDIAVTGIGEASKITVTLGDLGHETPRGVRAFVEGPTGQRITLLGDSGGSTPVSGVDLTFDDGGSTLPSSSTTITSGTYRPKGGPGLPTGQACGGTTTETMDSLNTGDLNGTWRLCMRFNTDFPGTGSVAGGWSISFDAGGGGSCPLPSAPSTRADDGCRYFVRVTLSQSGVQAQPALGSDSDIVHTDTGASGIVVFDKLPKLGRQIKGDLILDSVMVQTDEYLTPLGSEFRSARFTAGGATTATYFAREGLRHLTFKLLLESYDDTDCRVGRKGRFELTDVGSSDVLEIGKSVPKKSCHLNRDFASGLPGENDKVDIQIGDVQVLPV